MGDQRYCRATTRHRRIDLNSMKVIAQQNDTLDLICWRHLGNTAGVVEQTLLLNPAVSSVGAILPMGTTITLPDQPVKAATIHMIQLWD